MKQANSENIGAGDISFKHYMTGFILAVFLTIISFKLVLINNVSRQVATIGIFVSALLQILVHLRYFLHLDWSSAQRWNMIIIAFTTFLLFIFIAGTVWVMCTLNSRMM